MEIFGNVLAEKEVTFSLLVNSNRVKPENFDHLHLVYHFTIPLRLFQSPFLQFKTFQLMIFQISNLTYTDRKYAIITGTNLRMIHVIYQLYVRLKLLKIFLK